MSLVKVKKGIAQTLKARPTNILTYRPQDFQVPFVMSTAQLPCRIAPWCDGKTLCAIIMGLKLSQLYPGNEGLIIRRRFNALERSTIRDFEKWTGLKVTGQSPSVIIPGCNSRINFGHCDNIEDFRLAIQGMNLGWAYIEQADEFDSPEVLDMLLGRVRRILTPNDETQHRLIDFGIMNEIVNDFASLAREERERIETAIAGKLHLPVRQIIVIANACGHNWIYKRWHPSQSPLSGYLLYEGKPFENINYIPNSTLKNWEQLRIHSPKKYNRYVLNSHEDYDIEGSFYASLMSDALKEKRAELTELYDKTVPVYTFWDLGVGNATAIWFVQFVGQSIHLINYYEDSGQGMEFYSGVLDRMKYRYAEHWLPHDAKQRIEGPVITTRLDILRRLRINEDVYVVSRHSVEDRIQAVRSIIDKCRFDVKCERGVECLNKYHRAVNKMKSTDEKTCYLDIPDKEYSDGADAFGYMAVAYRYLLADKSGQILGATEAIPARLDEENINKVRKYRPLHFYTGKRRKVG